MSQDGGGTLRVAVESAMRSETRVSLRMTRVRLDEALAAIQRESGVTISYSAAQIPADRVVSLDVRDVPVSQAVQRVLQGTSVRVSYMADGRILLSAGDTKLQESGTVRGRIVSSKDKTAIRGATILLDDQTKGILSGDDGAFRLTVPVGQHQLVVRAVGFVRQTKSLTVSEGQTITLDLTLDPSANVLGEVIVTGTVVATERKAIPNPITVITADDIEKRGITQVGQLLRGEVPGVVSVDMDGRSYIGTLGQSSQTIVYSRGVANVGGGLPTTSPLKTYVDGVELLDPAYLGTLDPKSIERIEIITGPQAATVYGSGAIGGVMQIFTKKGAGRTAPEITVGLKYGILQNNFSTGKTPQHRDAVSLTGGTGPEFTYSANVSYNYTGQWQPMLFRRDVGASVGATHTHGPVRVTGSVSTTMGRNGTYSSDPYAANRYVQGAATQTSNTSRVVSQIVSGASSQTSSLNADYQMHRLWQHHLTVGRSQTSFELEPRAPTFGTPSDTLYSVQSSSGQRTTAGYNMTLLAPPMPHVTSTLTVGATGSWGDQTQVSGCIPLDITTTYAGCSASSAPSVTRPINNESWGGFGQWQIGLFDRMYLTLGLRGERNPTYGQAHKVDWTPTQGITYTAEYGDLTVKLLASYGRATRAPDASRRLEQVRIVPGYTPEQYISQLANPDLTPEYSRGPQGGIEVYYGSLISFTVNRYTQKITDVIYSVNADSIERIRLNDGVASYTLIRQYVNAATIRQFGWEGTGSVTLGPLSVKGTLSWADSRTIAMDSRTTYGGRWDDPFVDIAPPRYGNVTVSYAHGPTSVTLVSNIMGKTLAQASNNGIYYNLNGSERFSQYGVHAAPIGGRVEVLGYTKSDLAVSHRLSSSVSATLNMMNVTNTYRADIWAWNAALGRQTLFGISYVFPRR